MSAFVHWVLAQRYRLIVLAVVLAPVFSVGAALITLETLKRGPIQGSISAALASLGVVLMALISGAELQYIGVLGPIALFVGVGLGALVRWAGSLALAFQGTVLLCAIGVLGAGVLWPDPAAWVLSEFDRMIENAEVAGATAEQLAALQGWQAGLVELPMLGGAMFSMLFFGLIIALFLGVWWYFLSQSSASFGEQFRELKLGRVLGIPGTLVVGLGLALRMSVVQDFVPLSLAGFLLQGLAVAHAWSKAARWHPALLGMLYISLVTPFSLLVSSVGLLDNWINLRAPLRSVR